MIARSALLRLVALAAATAFATAFVGVAVPSRRRAAFGAVLRPHGGGVEEAALGAASSSVTATSEDSSSSSSSFAIYDGCDVAVLGGGFGGLYAALAIAREAEKAGEKIDVALVDPSDRFVFLPLLYDLTVGTASENEVCPAYADLLEGSGVRHVRASFDEFSNGDDDDAPSDALLTATGEGGGGDDDDDDGIKKGSVVSLSFRASVVAVGATPESILGSVPGAGEFAQPFYTREDAYATRELLFEMEERSRRGENPRIAVVGGGYGGVELAACVARRLPAARVTLVSKGAPMEGTRAEPLVEQALSKLGVRCETTGGIVEEISAGGGSDGRSLFLRRSSSSSSGGDEEEEEEDAFEAVLWTAGSGPAYPVGNASLGGGLALSSSGRLKVDPTLRCALDASSSSPSSSAPPVWALGDCSEIVPAAVPAVPRTAQAAMQQADVVASNVLSELSAGKKRQRRGTGDVEFAFEDLGSMLNLGGPNAAVLGPASSGGLSSLLVPVLDATRAGLGVADAIFAGIASAAPGVDADAVERLGLSLGGYGLGISDPRTTPGTISGTLSGAGRRAIYALRMPTGKQRAYAGASAFVSTAAALAKEAADQLDSAKTTTSGGDRKKSR